MPYGRRMDLRNGWLEGADLRLADLTGVDLRNSRLRNADLRNANLWNADLTGALNMDQVSTHGSLWGNTTCPDGDIRKGTSACSGDQLIPLA